MSTKFYQTAISNQIILNYKHRSSSIYLLLFFILISSKVFSQNFDPLLQLAWQNNEELKSKYFRLDKAEAAIHEAKSMYGPTLSFGTQYTLAYGGRTIQFPIGDLLNGVYNSLNELNQNNEFGQLENQEITFLPNNFYDARFRIQQPIYYPELSINRQVQNETLNLSELDIRAFKRLLTKEVMLAYFQYQSSILAVSIYQKSDSTLSEARRNTASMVKNGIALGSALDRINAEIADLQAKIIGAETDKQNALLYLNFLLGLPDSNRDIPNIDLPELPNIDAIQINEREELKQLDGAISLQSLANEKERAYFKPRLSAQLDLGSQDFNFGWQPYALMGVQLNINLFDNQRQKHKQAQLNAEIAAQQAQKTHTEKQIEMQISTTKNNLIAAINQANTYAPRIRAANRIYKDALSKYREGSANYIELLDGQTQIVNAELQFALAKYNAWTKWAETMYATASLTIE